MIELRNKRVLAVGLARTGRAVALRLSREGAVITVTDQRPPASFGPSLKELLAQKIGLELGAHRIETFLNQDLIVVSPGVPWDMPQLDAARKKNIPVVPEIEAASWFFQGLLVGITGSNGKTTVTTLLGKMLEASEFQTYVAGNIGVPLISAVDLYSPESIVVAELSSFQLEAIQKFRPRVAVLLNISPNHLDRHHTFEAYASAKAQIFRNQTGEDFAILNADDPVVMGIEPALASRKIFFSLERDLPEGVLLSGGRVLYRVGNLERALFEAREVKLRGAFNLQNAMAASAAACVLGADFKAIRAAVRDFAGVEHRLEHVATLRGIDFYNDSKATSVDAAAKALSTFERGVHLILGGVDKGAPYSPLLPLIQERVKSAYLIGAAAEKIAADLESAARDNGSPAPDMRRAGNLEAALWMAFRRAIPGDVILLSPACSSYDQFNNFEERGRAFKEAVSHLAGAPATETPFASFKATDPIRASDIPPATQKNADAAFAAAETVPQATASPVYVYETASEEVPSPSEASFAEPDESAAPAAFDNPTADEDGATALPYEVSGQPTTAASQRDAAENQGRLFERDREDQS